MDHSIDVPKFSHNGIVILSADKIPSNQVVGAVSAVVSAFHGGAELVAHIKKKHRKRKSEQAYKEKQLQESLQTGETQVDQRYASDCRELGEYMRKGDSMLPLHRKY